jgi:DNA-binding SARP family transcriptional activator/ATP/maltotriose-dependent transcriptional regulator MalT
MRHLPPHHVARPRLVERCAGYQVIVVEAAAGYGKSVLASELVDSWRTVGIDVELEQAGVGAALLAARLIAAVRRAGFTDAAAAVAEAGPDAVGAVDAIVTALASESCAFIIDDAHNARRDAGELIDRTAARLEAGQRLVVLARQLPEGAARLRRAEYLRLSSTDLTFTDDETLELCRSRFGLNVGPQAVHTLERATGGWTAATVLAAARAARTGESVGVVAEAAIGPVNPAGAVAAILDEALVTLGSSCRPLLAQVARLPLLDSELVDLVTACPGLFERGLKAGIPFGLGREPWWELPGPVSDYLATLAPARRDALRAAASEYSRRDELGSALQMLLGSGDVEEVADLLARTTPEAVEALDALEIRALFDQLPLAVVNAHPKLLLTVGHSFRVATQWEQAFTLFERARDIARRDEDPVLERAAEAELAFRPLVELKHREAEELARLILHDADRSEKLTRARAFHVLGHALCWHLDNEGRRDEAALVEAGDCFTQASNLYLALGMRSAASSLAPHAAIFIELATGRSRVAMRRLDEALALVVDRPRRWAYLMCFRAWVAAELGMDELCRASAEEAFRVAEQLKSDLFWAHGHWKLAILASYREDAEATLHHLRQVELHKGTWWAPASGDFLAEAADLLDRVGHTSLALEYLARVKAEPKDAGHLVALAEAAIEARHGDPVLAEARLVEAAQQRIDPREYWRVDLLRAYAAFRRGEDSLAGALAAQAFEEAARLDQPEVPLLRERAITEELLGLAVASGQPAALALRASALPVSLALLGRFELAVAGRPVILRSGQEVRLLKYVAASGGRVHVEQAIETMWPEVAPSAGRHRLRTVLNRLRVAAGGALSRDGEMLVVDETVRVDVQEFLAEAHRAQALAASDLALATAVARGAMSRYRGDLLPDDRYEEWAERPRQQARLMMLDLLDLCANEAAGRGDLDALRRTVERAIEFDPYDDDRYLKAVSTLLKQGRRGEALSVVNRARSAFAEIGLDPPRQLLDLERSIVA